jgi:hypothetical protein
LQISADSASAILPSNFNVNADIVKPMTLRE